MGDGQWVQPPSRPHADRPASSRAAPERTAPERVPLTGGPFGPAVALQRAIGNQAFTRLVGMGGTPVQRAGGDVDTAVSPVWDRLSGEFQSYAFEMARVNAVFPAVTRSRWSDQLTKLWSLVGGPGERTDAELDQLWNAFIQLQGLFAEEYGHATEAWADLQQAVEGERAALTGSGDPVDHAALDILDERFQETAKRVRAAGGFLVPEDLVGLHHMLDNQVHIDLGMRSYQRDLDRRARIEAEFADDTAEDDGPGVLGTAWDIVGWESWGDFAADAVLTIVTGGLGKIAKIGVKGTKAARRLNKLRKLAKLRKVRKIARLKKLADGVSTAFRAVETVLSAVGAVDSVKWVGKNWRKIARAYLTDEIGETVGGGNPMDAKNVLERVSKELVGEYVSKAIGVSSSDEADQLKAAVLAFAAGAGGLGKTYLRRYFRMNLKRRVTTNAVYYGLRVAVGEAKLAPGLVVDAATSASFEMAQDFVTRAIPFGKPAEFLVESVRKTVQKHVADAIKGALD